MSKTSESKFQSFLAARSATAPPSGTTEGDATPTETASGRRSAGKRSDPAYEQVTAYIRRRTHDAVKMVLLKEGQRRQFSELAEELLARWVEERD